MAVYVYIGTSKLYKEENVRRGGTAKKLKMYFCADVVKSALHAGVGARSKSDARRQQEESLALR